MNETISLTRCGQMAFHTPTPMASVDTLEKPHIAYVTMASDLACKYHVIKYVTTASDLDCEYHVIEYVTTASDLARKYHVIEYVTMASDLAC